MGNVMILGVVIASPVVLSVVAFLFAPASWLEAFGTLARSLGRLM